MFGPPPPCKDPAQSARYMRNYILFAGTCLVAVVAALGAVVLS